MYVRFSVTDRYKSTYSKVSNTVFVFYLFCYYYMCILHYLSTLKSSMSWMHLHLCFQEVEALRYVPQDGSPTPTEGHQGLDLQSTPFVLEFLPASSRRCMRLSCFGAQLFDGVPTDSSDQQRPAAAQVPVSWWAQGCAEAHRASPNRGRALALRSVCSKKRTLAPPCKACKRHIPC